MAIMGYDEWLRRTKMGVLKPRSGPLKVLDAAIREWERYRGSAPHMETLRAAFIAWADAKGGQAESSGRNAGGAVTELMNQLIAFRNENQPTRHVQPPTLLQDIRRGAQLLAEGKLKPQIKVKLSLGELDTGKGTVIWEEFDSTQIVKARNSWSRAYDCAELAVNGVSKVATNDNESERFRRWFGNPAPDRVAKIRADLEKMRTTFKTAKITIVNREDIQTHLVNGDDPLGEMTDSFSGDGVYGFVWNHSAGSGYRIVMGKHFLFDPDIVEGATQTIYHELTHKVLKTRDHVYGKIKSRSLAVGQPANAITNADNFAFYAVSFIKDI